MLQVALNLVCLSSTDAPPSLGSLLMVLGLLSSAASHSCASVRLKFARSLLPWVLAPCWKLQEQLSTTQLNKVPMLVQQPVLGFLAACCLKRYKQSFQEV